MKHIDYDSDELREFSDGVACASCGVVSVTGHSECNSVPGSSVEIPREHKKGSTVNRCISCGELMESL